MVKLSRFQDDFQIKCFDKLVRLKRNKIVFVLQTPPRKDRAERTAPKFRTPRGGPKVSQLGKS